MSDTRASAVFEDFDLKSIYNKCREAILSVDTQNFVLEFDNLSAKCALDVDHHAMRGIISAEVRESYGTYRKWLQSDMCITAPQKCGHQVDVRPSSSLDGNLTPANTAIKKHMGPRNPEGHIDGLWHNFKRRREI